MNIPPKDRERLLDAIDALHRSTAELKRSLLAAVAPICEVTTEGGKIPAEDEKTTRRPVRAVVVVHAAIKEEEHETV